MVEVEWSTPRASLAARRAAGRPSFSALLCVCAFERGGPSAGPRRVGNLASWLWSKRARQRGQANDTKAQELAKCRIQHLTLQILSCLILTSPHLIVAILDLRQHLRQPRLNSPPHLRLSTLLFSLFAERPMKVEVVVDPSRVPAAPLSARLGNAPRTVSAYVASVLGSSVTSQPPLLTRIATLRVATEPSPPPEATPARLATAPPVAPGAPPPRASSSRAPGPSRVPGASADPRDPSRPSARRRRSTSLMPRWPTTRPTREPRPPRPPRWRRLPRRLSLEPRTGAGFACAR